MRFENLIRVLMAVVMLQLSACAYNHHEVLHDADQDEVYTFGVLPTRVEDFSAGTLMLMGKKYWYVIQGNDAKPLAAVLNAGLSKRYRLFDETNQQELFYLPISIERQKPDSVSTPYRSKFCLRYQSNQPKEIEKLTELSFELMSNQDGEYTRCLYASGLMYGSPKNVVAQYRFEKFVPIRIFYVAYKRELDVGESTKKIVAIPFAIAALPVALAIALPVVLIMGINGV